MNRLFIWMLITFSLPVAAWSGDDPPPGRREQVEHLEEVHETVRKVGSGLSLLSKAAWVGWVVTGRDDLAKASEVIQEFEEPVEKLEGTILRMLDAVTPDDRKPDRVIDGLKGLQRQALTIRKLGDTVKLLPVGLVADTLDDRFRVTPKLLVENPREAGRRFAALVEAMQANRDYLDRTSDQLDELALRAKGAATILNRLNEGIEKAVRTGLFAQLLVDKYLDIDRLEGACRSLAADSGTKADAMKRVSAEQERRQENLKENVATFFGIKL